MTAVQEQRRAVERMLGSKNHCSAELSRRGRELIRTHEALIEALEMIRDEAGGTLALEVGGGTQTGVKDGSWCAGVAMAALAAAEERARAAQAAG